MMRRRRTAILTVAAALVLGAPSALTLPARHAPAAAAGGHWRAHLQRVDDALAAENLKAAVEAWREAQAAALESLGWEGMVEVGDAYLRIGDVVSFRRAFVDRARANYRVALERAQHQRSPAGVRRAIQASVAIIDQDGRP